MLYIVKSMSYSNDVTTGTLSELAANDAELAVGVATARRCHGMLNDGVYLFPILGLRTLKTHSRQGKEEKTGKAAWKSRVKLCGSSVHRMNHCFPRFCSMCVRKVGYDVKRKPWPMRP